MLTDFHLPLDVDAVLRGQGIDDPAGTEHPAAVRARHPAVLALAERALDAGQALLAPQAVCQSWEIESLRHKRITLAGGRSLSGPLVSHCLAGAQRVTAVVCTIGEALEQQSSLAMRSEPAFALALDGLGSAAVEALAAEICRMLGGQAPPGWRASLPISPGLDGWEVGAGQAEIFGLVDATPIGVRLLPSGMMTPRKSASFVVGFGPHIAEGGQTCDFCSMRQTCRYRERHDPR